MRNMQTEVLVIGGGATGIGVLRDLAMRGFKAILVERGDLTNGTTGRYHGLLHSGGRYVVKDPHAAVECIQENRILRRIMPQCIEDTGGFFVTTPWDDEAYAERFLVGCQKAGIPIEEVPISQMLREEPLLNPRIQRCLRVPDGSADSFLANEMNAAAARQYGAQVFNYHKVTSLIQDKQRILGARCHDLTGDEDIEIYADLVINASGAWAGIIAGMAGIQVNMVPGKGVMVAVNHRIVNTVINRCKMPADGDILVPAHTVAVIGTTDVKVENPDAIAIEPWEVRLMLEEGERMVPGFKEMRMLRAWACVRPLYKESGDAEALSTDNREMTRSYVLLDHETRDGVSGMVTITSGKWTTYRKMAEATVDLACQKLGRQRPCRTHLEALPAHEEGHHYLGARLAQIEKKAAYGQLVCECELATYADVVEAITSGQAKTIDDIRRDVRLGMGPCQGGFCTYRAAGMLYMLRQPPVEEANLALRDFLQERWKGLLPILWGQQLRQERLDELIYLSLLNADHLLGSTESILSPTPYASPSEYERPTPDAEANIPTFPLTHGKRLPGEEPTAQLASSAVPKEATSPQPAKANGAQTDLVVIGAGLAGLTTAWLAADYGLRVRLISKGWGALYWHSGCIDVLGYYPADNKAEVEAPGTTLNQLIRSTPNHPYALAGKRTIHDAIESLQILCASAGYPLLGSLEHNWRLPSALGTARPTCLAPETMVAGDLSRSEPALIVGFEGFQDFYPEWIAANLERYGIPASGLALDLPSLKEHSFISGRVLAELFEGDEFQAEVITAINNRLASIQPQPRRIGFPAVLGLARASQILRNLQNSLGSPVFEIPTLPPSIPGMRLQQLLVAAIEKMGGRVFEGMQVNGIETDGNGRLRLVWSEAAARRKPHPAKAYILATGGMLGGGLKARYEGKIEEVVCDLPVSAPMNRNEWLKPRFLDAGAHPIYQAGLAVNRQFQPIDVDGKVIYDNLYAAGGNLQNENDCLRERSLDGVALVTGAAVAKLAAQSLAE
jgi:glycerol-3-phosphate dehydrogenase